MFEPSKKKKDCHFVVKVRAKSSLFIGAKLSLMYLVKNKREEKAKLPLSLSTLPKTKKLPRWH